MKYSTVSIIAALSHHVAGHGIVTKIVAGTKTYQGYNPNFQYMPTPPPTIGWAAPATQDMGPVPGDPSNPDIICQRGATNAKTSAEIAAGDMVSVQWTPWPASHKGPMLDYLADCGGDCSTVDKSTLKFFKIDGVGMTGLTGTPSNYADDDMIAANNTWSVKIPATIKAGNYVLRHETIALHQAQAAGGAQYYPQCVNLQVTGGGSDVPAGVLGTQLYKATDPGVMFNIYQQFKALSDYPVPGPPLYVAGGSPNPPAGSAQAPAATASPSAAKRSTSATAPNATGGMISPCKSLPKRHARDFQAGVEE